MSCPNSEVLTAALLRPSDFLAFFHPVSPPPLPPPPSEEKKRRDTSMETSPVNRERGVPASPTAPPHSMLLPSPTSNNSSTTSSSSSGNNKSTANGHSHHYPNQYSPHRPPSTPTTPKQQQQQQSHQTITRSDSNNPYPTTFVQADTSSFKQVVQMLTGSSDASKVASPPKHTTESDHLSHPHPHRHHHHHHHQPPPKGSIPPIKTPSKLKPSKLYERRNSLKNFKINPLAPGFGSNSGFSPRNADILSPSMLDFPSLVLSPVTPLIADPFNRSPSAIQNGKPNDIVVDKAAEEKAIAEKGFYLHPSPASTPRESEPRLLPLFPVTSPRVSGSDSNFS